MAMQKTTYEEVGVVIDENIESWIDLKGQEVFDNKPLKGCLVYFDSWLAKKFPVKGQTDKFVWFVKYEDIVAYEPLP